MVGGICAFFVLGFARKEFYVETVTRFEDLPTSGRVIKVPDVSNQLVCVAADVPKLRLRHTYGQNYSAAFDKYFIGHPITLNRDADSFVFCYKCNSTLNGRVLGNFKEFRMRKKRLFYVASGGAECAENTTYSLKVEFVCDKTLHKGDLNIPTFVYRDKEKCKVRSLVRSRYACRLPWLESVGANGIHNIKCIAANLYDEGVKRLRESL